MKRIEDTFIQNLERIVGLRNKRVLEIGCGTGTYTVQIASRCAVLVATDPNPDSLEIAKRSAPANIDFVCSAAEDLKYPHGDFAVIIFTLSFHHVEPTMMRKAIDVALAHLHPMGILVFLEPGTVGSYFDAEIAFDACDGDERNAKLYARAAMANHPRLKPVTEILDQTAFELDSVDDFVAAMEPKKGTMDSYRMFLQENNYVLCAERRISFFRR